ncbi:ribonuclease HII [Ureibacillus manganicus]|uniref:Ribonuclease HII n=1 Tax=Ureibacillus manganicus DSM 26584 TaxID=1384049 RepID=A0A0A3IC39_9BACL|nr:ribonuclease HII [Ureibacillus manganicus]KGR80373.1 ribonuclease HII [Ureibacillus manganicus DSM 26584]
MKTVKEITIELQQAREFEEWMSEIQNDERAGVQKAWISWQNRYEKHQKLVEEHQNKIDFDASFKPFKGAFIAGVDEAGRGPLAGPVVTAAVILPEDCEALIGINDSKQLSKVQRANFAETIKQHALTYSIHFQDVETIDEINIYEATKQSMKQSVLNLHIKPHYVILDAMEIQIDTPQSSIIKGDAKSLAIASASILAKYARDEYMEQLHKEFPHYGFDQHAGYGTKLHLEAISTYGPTIHHRKSFEPIKSMILK